MSISKEIKTKLNILEHSGGMIAGISLSYELLIGKEDFSDTNKLEKSPHIVLELIRACIENLGKS